MVLVVASVVGVLAVALGITGYVYYDRATAPDRTAPDVAVDNFLRAYLVDRDDGETALYTCKTSDIGPLADYRGIMVSLENRYSIAVRARWGALTVSDHSKDRASVTTNINLEVPEATGQSSESRTSWTFVTVRQSGWRVCEAHQVS